MNRIVYVLLLLVAIYTVMNNAAAPPREQVQGVAHVHDGDTLTVAGVKIRLFGVDAPEYDQTCKMPDGSNWACGIWSRDQLRRLLDGKELRCVKRTYDKYGRMVARCYLGDQDFAERLVRDGIVFSYARYSQDYVPVEKQAAVAGRGLWQAEVVKPEEFRRQKRHN